MEPLPTFTYKGYSAVIRRDESANVFHGEVVGIRNVVTFQSSSHEGMRQAFEDSVDDYLAFREGAKGKQRSRKFTVMSPHPLALGKHFSVPWADVYLLFTTKPGRQ